MMEEPQFSSLPESKICYATVAMVTDYDCWPPNHEDLTVDAIVKVLLANADKARSLVKRVAHAGARRCQRGWMQLPSALPYAIITAPEARDTAMAKKLSEVAGRVLKK